MVTLYETERGDHAPASALTADEAVRAYQQGWLLATDVQALTPEALEAVVRVFEAGAGLGVRAESGSIWGRKAGDKRPVITTKAVQ